MSARNTTTLNYRPTTISLVSTEKCTLSCSMCPTHSPIVPENYPYAQNTTKDIDLKLFREVRRKFPEAINLQIIGSGEPLLNEEFYKIVDFAVKEKMTVKTVSNGTIIDQHIERLVNSSLNGILISVNGHNPTEYGRITGEDPKWFEIIIKNSKDLINKVRKEGSPLKVKASFILDKNNYKTIPDCLAIAEKIGFDETFLCSFLPTHVEGLTTEERCITSEDTRIIEEIREIYQNTPEKIRRKTIFPRLFNKENQKNQCRCHFEQIRVNGNGDISSCSMMLLNMSNGTNVFDEGDIWNNVFFTKQRRNFLQDKSESIEPPCRECIDNHGFSPID